MREEKRQPGQRGSDPLSRRHTKKLLAALSRRAEAGDVKASAALILLADAKARARVAAARGQP